MGVVPIVSSHPTVGDRWGTILARLGVTRNSYLVAPGLYGIGDPGETAPIVVSANYKLSFDSLRFELQDQDVWLLVLDTCGINVWCAAGKGTFSSSELVNRIKQSGVKEIVSHRQLVVPQLGATGIEAHKVRKESGFEVHYGPVRARDLVRFLSNGEADPEMRSVTFDLAERAVLIPVEVYLLAKPLLWLIPICFVISGIGPQIWSMGQGLERGLQLLAALGVGLVGGLVLVPLLLPWLPGRAFSIKGLVAGIGCGGLLLFFLGGLSGMEQGALLLAAISTSSYLGMNFTGSTPFTSPSGVEWEMKRALPLQLLLAVAGIGLWVAAPFTTLS